MTLCILYAEEQKQAVLILNLGASWVKQNQPDVSMCNDVKGQIRDGRVLRSTQTFGGFSLVTWLDSL